MKKIFFILISFFVYNLYSQNEYVNQVLILNEGSYDYYEEE